MVAAGRLADITADHIEISDTEVIDAADDVAQLRLVRDLPGGEMRDDFISCLDREFGVSERSSQAELRRTGDGNLRAAGTAFSFSCAPRSGISSIFAARISA